MKSRRLSGPSSGGQLKPTTPWNEIAGKKSCADVAQGQKRGFERAPETSAVAPIATQSLHRGNRRCGPNADIARRSFDHLVGAHQ